MATALPSAVMMMMMMTTIIVTIPVPDGRVAEMDALVSAWSMPSPSAKSN